MQTTGQLVEISSGAKSAAFAQTLDETSQFYTLQVRKM
jgi:hypothetical protein